MKNIILILISLFFVQMLKAQSVKEIFSKMKDGLSNINNLSCSFSKTAYYINNYTFYYQVDAIINFDTCAKFKPSINMFFYSLTENYDTNTIVKNKYSDGKKFIKVNRTTKEVNIDNIENDKQRINERTQFDLFPLFYYDVFTYIDSLFKPDYENENIDMKNIKFEVSSDTSCLSGDCYLLKISAPSLLGTEIENDSTDDVLTVYFNQEINTYWVNKKSFFPERFKREITINDNSYAVFEDTRFGRIEKNFDIDDKTFKYDSLIYSDYRIEKIVNDELITIQQAFIKAPEIKGIDQNGDSINLYKNNSKIYIIDFWFSKCTACMDVKSFIENKIISKYKNTDVMIIGVNPNDKSFEQVSMILKDKLPLFPYIINKALARQYHLSAYPGIYILNSKFEVIKSYNSFSDKIGSEILNIIERQLK